MNSIYFKNAENIINGKSIENYDYVDIKTKIINIFEFSNNYSRSSSTNIFGINVL